MKEKTSRTRNFEVFSWCKMWLHVNPAPRWLTWGSFNKCDNTPAGAGWLRGQFPGSWMKWIMGCVILPSRWFWYANISRSQILTRCLAQELCNGEHWPLIPAGGWRTEPGGFGLRRKSRSQWGCSLRIGTIISGRGYFLGFHLVKPRVPPPGRVINIPAALLPSPLICQPGSGTCHFQLLKYKRNFWLTRCEC